MAASDDHQVIDSNGCCTGAFSLSAATPQFLAGLKIVGTDFGLSRDDDLLLVAVVDDDRRAPVGRFVTIGFPNRFASQFIEAIDGRWAFMIPRHNQFVFKKKW